MTAKTGSRCGNTTTRGNDLNRSRGNDEADRLADRLVIIDGGRVVAEGTADRLKGDCAAMRYTSSCLKLLKGRRPGRR